MIDLFLNGGLVTMSFLTLLFIFVIIASNKRKHLVRSLGLLAFIVGLLSSFLGIYSAIAVIEQMGNASPVIVAGGVKTALTTFIYGIFIFVVSIILDIVNKNKLQ
jgi:biopolymer transport protein ExbB/TolQ